MFYIRSWPRHGGPLLLSLAMLVSVLTPPLASPAADGAELRSASFTVPGLRLLGQAPPYGALGLGPRPSGDGQRMLIVNEHLHARVTDLATGADTAVDANAAGVVSDYGVYSVDMSSDARFAFFISDATNLVTGPTSDLYVKDLQTGELTNLDVSYDGLPLDGYSEDAAISANGRYLVFTSNATNLVAATGDSNSQVYRYDQVTGTLTLVTHDGAGGYAVGGGAFPQISDDGNRVVYESSADNGGPYPHTSVWLRDVGAGTVTDLEEPTCIPDCPTYYPSSYYPHISADGRYVAYDTGNAPTECATVRRDLSSGTRQIVSGEYCTQFQLTTNISDDGSTVSFFGTFDGSNPEVIVWHASTNSWTNVNRGVNRYDAGQTALNGDGSIVAFDSTADNLVLDDTDQDRSFFVTNTATDGYAIVAPEATEMVGGGAPVTPGTQVPCVADPINTATGALVESFCDLKVPGRGVALDFRRSYDSSQASSDGPLGYGWTHSYAMSLSDEGWRIQVREVTGSTVPFTARGDGSYAAPSRVRASLTKDAAGHFHYTRPSGETYTFSPVGVLESARDRNDNITTLSYNSVGNLATVTDPAGRALSLAYGTDGRISQLTDTAGRVVTYAYSTAGDLVSVTDPAGTAMQFGYDTRHRMTIITDARGHSTTNVFDSAHRVTSQTDRAGRTTALTYAADAAGRAMTQTVTVTDPRGIRTRYDYLFGLLVQLTEAEGTADEATWNYEYDLALNVARRISDPLGHVTDLSYDTAGNLTSRTDPLGHRSEWTYNALHQPLTSTDPSGVTTTFSYDSAGNALTAATPLAATGQIATTTYHRQDVAHPDDITGVTDPRGKTSHLTYDEFGQLTSRTDPLGRTTTYSYGCSPLGPGCRPNIDWLYSSVSALGNAPGADPALHTTSYARDDAGRITTATDPHAQNTTSVYDGNGNATAVTDAKGKTTSYTYNQNNERTTVTRPDGSTIHTSFDANGNVLSQTDAANQSTHYTYDLRNRVATVTDPLVRVSSYIYDAAGRLVTRTDPTGRTTSYGYDAADRPTSVDYSDAATPDVTYGYDRNGRRTLMTDGSGVSVYAYDSLGRLTYSTNGAGNDVDYTYDLAGQVTAIGYPNGKAVVRAFDDAGQLTGVTDWNSNSTIFDYDANGALTNITYPNGVSETTTRDRTGRPTALVNTIGASTIASYTYQRDPLGLLTATAPSGVTGQTDETYGHDSLNQLTTYTTTASTGTYAYDAADNLIGLPDGTAQFYNAANELTDSAGPAGTFSYGYNGLGSRTSRTGAAGTISYGYDQAQRLTSFTAPDAQGATYGYNGDGLRTSKNVGTTVHSFSWDIATSGLPLLLSDGTTSYLYGPGGLAVAQIAATPAISTVGTGTALDAVGTASSLSVPFSTAAASGDQILLAVNHAAGQNPAAPAGYSTVGTFSAPSADVTTAVYRRTATGGESSTTVTFTQGVVVHAKSVLAILYRGVDPTNPIDAASSAGTTTPDATITVPAVNTATPGGHLVLIQHALNNLLPATWAEPAAMTTRVETGGNTIASATADQPVVDSGTTGTRTATLSEPAQLVGVLLALRRAPSTHYLHHDQQSSTRVITDPSGAVTATYSYDPYGRITSHSGSQTALLYNGQYRDHESGLYYLRARYYDPTTAQFLTRDPLHARTRASHGYAGNAPLDHADPSGLDWRQDAGDWSAGFGDVLTLGGTEQIRRLLNYALNGDTDDPANQCSDFYSWGRHAGDLASANPGGAGARFARHAAEGGRKLVEGARYPLAPKIQGQLGNRGWTTEAIDEAVQSGQQVRAVNKATGNPATRHVHPTTGQSVVIDDVTGQVIHVGGPGFKYGPGSGDLP
jgi:RHS repeat-associated protein